MGARVSFVGLLAVGLLAASASGQDKPPAPAPPKAAAPQAPAEPGKAEMPYTEAVDVAITNVDVIVTDSKGKRVPGLTAADFEIKQDGIPQAITNFYAVSGGKVLLEDGKEIPLDQKEVEAEVPQTLKAHYVFFIDNLNIQPNNRNRMFKRLKEFIPEAIGPNAEGMIVTFNRSLKVRRNFTTNTRDLLEVIGQIELETGGGTATQSDRRDAIQKINDAKTAAEAASTVRSYSQSVRNDLEFTVDAIKTTIDGLAGLPGRKNFIYVSEGLPASVGIELWDAIFTKFQNSTYSMNQYEYDMNAKYTTIARAANAAGVTIYPLDASGLAVNEMVTAQQRTTDVHINDFFVRQNMQGPIKMLAEETGGLVSVNTNDWKSTLDEIGADFSNFYSLGYRSAKGAIDRPHKIEVSVKKKGMTVRTRSSFVEKSVETRTAEGVIASLHYPRTENPLHANLSVGEPKPYDAENYTIAVRVAVPLSKITLVPAGEQYEGQFFVYFVVLDVSGNQSDLQVQQQHVRVPKASFEAAQRKDFYFDATLVVVPGGQTLAVAVRDAVSSQTSYLQRKFFVSVLPKEKQTPPAAKPGA